MPAGDLSGFYQATRDCRRIMVVDLGFLGDTVHLIPALWEIKAHYPEAQLHVLTTPVGSEVLKLVSCVDRSWSFPLGPPSPKWWEHLDILKAMRRERFDLVYNFGGADRSVFITRIISRRNAMAYQGARKHFWQPWLVPNWIPARELPTPVYESRREILRLCGFKLSPVRFDLTVPKAEADWAEKNIPAGSVHVSLNASAAFREWPVSHLVEFTKRLLSFGLDSSVFVSAAPTEREQARLKEFKKSVADPRLHFLEEKLSIVRLAAMLRRCALHFGPDSGMLHLADAVGIKTVSLFRRSSSMSKWLPLGKGHAYFDAECECLKMNECPCEVLKDSKCLREISPDAVADKILEMLTDSGS